VKSRMRIRGACAGGLLLLATTLVPSSASALELKAQRPAVWAVGDSVTVYSADALRSRLSATLDGPIRIDAEIGRNVDQLDDLVRQQLARGRRPKTMVLALGTNPDPGWTLVDYRRVVDAIPDSVTVVLVTVFRSRGTASAPVLQQMNDYSRWMRRIARSRDNVCLAPWRSRVRAHPGRYLRDGVHPNDRGARAFADVIAGATAQCTET
jgi:hypothetical protein